MTFLKSCQLMRDSLLAANFKITGNEEHVMFAGQPPKLKKAVSKVKLSLRFMNLKKKKAKNSKGLDDADPKGSAVQSLVSESPTKVSTPELSSKKEKQRQKEFCNSTIDLYKEVAKCFQSYKDLMQSEGLELEHKYKKHLDAMQREMTMANKILIGQSLSFLLGTGP